MTIRWKRLLLGTGLFVGLQALSRIGVRPGAERRIYGAVRKPRWSPPPWLFAPAWTINTAARLAGDLALLDQPRSRARTATLALEGVSWLAYVAFSPLFFGLGRPRLGLAAALTQTGATVGAALAARRVDRRFARRFGAALAPTAAWLVYADALAAAIAARNPASV